jgi:superfamily I DNA and RNA helicase
MPLDIIVTSGRISRDPIARDLFQQLQSQAGELGLTNAVLYYDFPVYSDYETVSYKPDSLILSPSHGIVAIRLLSESDRAAFTPSAALQLDESLVQFCSILIGRLLKSASLRKGLGELRFPVTPIVYASQPPDTFRPTSSRLVTSWQGLCVLLDSLRVSNLLPPEVLAEARSVLEGAKALTRPQKRVITDPETHLYAAALAALEAEIANFDQRQRRAALVTINGPQRIRGLAGSGKTVILAMKAAHLHMTAPSASIAVTFFTRSLRNTLKQLVTRFYRHHRDEDPDWSQIHIRHGWGGARTEGIYSDACRRNGVKPLTLPEAQRGAVQSRTTAFDFACRQLLETGLVTPHYDYVLIDEGQDFPPSFYQLCYELAVGERDQKNIVWAYDELQTILDVKIRPPEVLFGTDTDGEPRVSLDRTAGLLPPGATNDSVLNKCYRNQGEVLVTAHALGFGIYGKHIVQLLESGEHWEDVGYEVVAPTTFAVGTPVKIQRPPAHSPLSLPSTAGGKTIGWYAASSFSDEIKWVVNGVRTFVEGGLQPEDILVITLDDRNAKTYLKLISGGLAAIGISSNNIIADPYTEPPFTLPRRVTLSTVYRAKGNEAAVVFAVGVDAVDTDTRSGRNRLFTAFTRTKAWLRVSGSSKRVEGIGREIQSALTHFPYLEFKMPDLREVELIQRDLSERTAKAKKIREEYERRLLAEGFSEEEILDILSPETKNG